MPGKVNPVIPEAVQQVACQVVGNDAAVTFAAGLSTFELNTAMPVMARNLLESLQLLSAWSRCWPIAASPASPSRRRRRVDTPSRPPRW